MFDGDLLRERARLTPGKCALVVFETDERLTYGELDERTDAAAAAIRATGAEPGDRIGLLASNSIDFVALFFAAGRAGVIIVPLSTRAAAGEIARIVADSSMRVLFTSAEFEPVVAGLPLPVAALETVRSASPDLASPSDRRDGEAIYCLLYTSGTTGAAKGVMIPKTQLLWNGYNTAVCWDLKADDVSPIFVPLCHAGGLSAFLIPIFCAGGTIVLHRGFEPAAVWASIERERCTVVLGVPTIWKMLAESPAFATVNLEHVRWFVSGGAPLPAHLIDVYAERGVALTQGYGMTEVGVNCFTMTTEDSRRKAGSIGKPLMLTEVRLVDGDGREVPPGEVGEMEIRGAHVSAGYWNNETATREAYRRDGWFRTGDLARCDEEGFFYIAGRRKEMFISGGLNVYPAEVEAMLLTHPRVRDAAVIAVDDATWGESGVAFVVGDATDTDLDSWLEGRIARYKIPRRYEFVDALPRTAFGKVIKEELRALLRR